MYADKPELEGRIKAELRGAYPQTLRLEELGGWVEYDRDTVRLTLLDLHRRGIVSKNGDGGWRVVDTDKQLNR